MLMFLYCYHSTTNRDKHELFFHIFLCCSKTQLQRVTHPFWRQRKELNSYFHCSCWPHPWEGQQNLKEDSWWRWYYLGLELPAADSSLLYACFLLLLCWAKGKQSRGIKRARQEPKTRLARPSDAPSAGGRMGKKVPVLTGPDGAELALNAQAWPYDRGLFPHLHMLRWH